MVIETHMLASWVTTICKTVVAVLESSVGFLFIKARKVLVPL